MNRKSNVVWMCLGNARPGFYGSVTRSNKIDIELIDTAVMAVMSSMNVPFKKEGFGSNEHYIMGPHEDREDAQKALVEINNYYQHLLSKQSKGNPLTYEEWRNECARKANEKRK